MMTAEAPLVTLDGLSDLALPAVMGVPKTRAEMSKSGWLEWLESHNRFKFENPHGGKFTAYKSAKNYWTAQRRVQGKLRHEYLGSSSDLTYELLDQVARKMGMGNSAYWREKYPDPRAVHKPSVESHKESYETVSKSSSQTSEEVDELKRQIAELELRLSMTERKLEESKSQIVVLKASSQRINLECKIYKLHGHEVVRLKDLAELGYELQRNS
jgi:hypothetical protein